MPRRSAGTATTPRRQITVRLALEEVPRPYAVAEVLAESEFSVAEEFFTTERFGQVVASAASDLAISALDRKASFEQARIDAALAKVQELDGLGSDFLTPEGIRVGLRSIRLLLLNVPQDDPVEADVAGIAEDPMAEDAVPAI